jgi:hypothetical protein
MSFLWLSALYQLTIERCRGKERRQPRRGLVLAASWMGLGFTGEGCRLWEGGSAPCMVTVALPYH